jgi:hypothetical protein
MKRKSRSVTAIVTKEARQYGARKRIVGDRGEILTFEEGVSGLSSWFCHREKYNKPPDRPTSASGSLLESAALCVLASRYFPSSI